MPPESGLFQFPGQNLLKFGIGNAGTANAQPGALGHIAAPGEDFPQQGGKGSFADGIDIEGAEFSAA